MGMHIGIVAARVPVAKLREVFLALHPKYELTESSGELEGDDELWDWVQAHERSVSAAEWSPQNRGKEVYGLWRDGEWAVLMDKSYVLPSDAEALAQLSKEVGEVLAVVVETTSGCGEFTYLASGGLVRRVTNNDGEVECEGEPIPQEAGIGAGPFYMEQAEALGRAFGIVSLTDLSGVRELQAFTVVDHTDYSGVVSPFGPVAPKVEKTPPAVLPAPAKRNPRPWWKFW